MTTARNLSDAEQHALLAVWRLGSKAYGNAIRDEIGRCTGRHVSTSAIYVTLVRLEREGLVTSTRSEPTPVRGGKARRLFRVKPAGVKALQHARRSLNRLWEGLDPVPKREVAG